MLPHKLSHYIQHQTFHGVLDDVQLFSSFSAQKKDCIKLDLCIECCRHAIFIPYVHLCLQTVSTDCKTCTQVSKVTRKFLSQKSSKRALESGSSLLQTYEKPDMHQKPSYATHCKARGKIYLSFFRNQGSYGDFLGETLTSVPFMISFKAGFSTVVNYFKILFAGSSRVFIVA